MSVGTFNEVMFRERAHKIQLQLLTEDDELPVTGALSGYSHRLIAKLHHSDADVDAVFNLTDIFAIFDEGEKIVEATIPASATEHAQVPEGKTTRLYLQWETTDPVAVTWLMADGSLVVRSVLSRGA